MANLKQFKERIRELYRQATPFDDSRKPTQKELAEAMGLSHTELNRRLNGSDQTQLHERDVWGIIRVLVEWDAVVTQDQLLELCALGGASPLRPSQWQEPPFDRLLPRQGEPTSHPQSRQNHNLPRQANKFIGREGEIATVRNLLRSQHLVTLTGAGGCGKTRLALTIAAKILPRYRDGVWLIELAFLREADLVPRVLADLLGITAQGGISLEKTILQNLQNKELVLLLDNCEHLIEPVALMSALILDHSPGVTILATSREPLRLPGETIFPVYPLTFPPRSQKVSVAELANYEAIRLFTAQLRQVDPEFKLSAENAPDVQEICARLDGIPLALELAASRGNLLSPAEINARLSDRFRLLRGGKRTALPHHQTLEALIDWSHALLSLPEQILFYRLAIFPADFNLEAVEGICREPPLEQALILEILADLINKSLIMRLGHKNGTRYRFLETIREFALKKLGESGELNRLNWRHCVWFQNWTADLARKVRSPLMTSCFKKYEIEQNNIHAALNWASGQADGVETEISLVVSLWDYWFLSAYVQIGKQRLAHALLRSAQLADQILLARLYLAAGMFNHYPLPGSAHIDWLARSMTLLRRTGEQHDLAFCLAFSEADPNFPRSHPGELEYLYESEQIYKNLEDKWGLALVYYRQGSYFLLKYDFGSARHLLQDSVDLYRQIGEEFCLSWPLSLLGELDYVSGNYETATYYLEWAISLQREMKNKSNMAQAIILLGQLKWLQKEYTVAASLYQESIQIWLNAGYRLRNALPLFGLGLNALAQGEWLEAEARFKESYELYLEGGDQIGIFLNMVSLAALYLTNGRQNEGVSLLEEAKSLHLTFGQLSFVQPIRNHNLNMTFSYLRQQFNLLYPE